MTKHSQTFLIAKFCFGLTLGILISSCAHHNDVRPGANGLNRVRVRKSEKSLAEQSALSQAKHFCKERNLFPEVISETTEYTGSMDESTRETLKRASGVALVLGGTMKSRTNTFPTETGPGDVVQGAGQAGHMMTDGDDYLTEMTFRCQ